MLQIIQLDNDFIERVNLQLGNNIIGCGVATGTDDELVAKHAFTINLAPNDEMTIKPALPCYMKSRESSRWQLLQSGVTLPIKPGDICSLLPRKCWFKIVSMADNVDSTCQSGTKRKANEDLMDSDTDIADKKSRIESQADADRNRDEPVAESLTSGTGESRCQEKSDQESVHSTKNGNTVCDTTLLQKEETKVCENPNPECNEQAQGDSQQLEPIVCMSGQESQPLNSASSEITGSSKAAEKIFRERCKYGEKCYRRNPGHKTKYSHPGDIDYNTPDDRKECVYGRRCYRKNPEHRAKFKHTSKKTSRLGKGEGNVFLRKRTTAKTNQGDLSQGDDFSEDSAEESVDESEYEPSSESRENSEDEQYSSGIEWEDETVV